MKIGMLVDVYKPRINGVINYISLNKRFLEKLGHEIFVFTFGDEDYLDEEPNVIRSPGIPLLDTGYYLSLRYTQTARRLVRMMDVVHVHHPFISGSLAMRYCRPRGIPIVFTNHTRYDLYTQAYLPALPDVVGLAALEAFLPAFCRACDLVISPSPGMRDVLGRLGVDTLVDVVPNGVDLKPFQQPAHPIDRQELGFGAEDILLVYTGRLGPEKNLPFLLRSFAGAAQAYNNIGLVLIGDGPEGENLKDRASQMAVGDRIRFTGLVPYEELPNYLATADAFVTASVTEVHPLSVIEALAAGLPVLGIQSPGVGDSIQDGETGFLAPEGDLAAFTAKMVRLVTEHELRSEMGEKARQAANLYAIERTTQMMVERYEQVYASTLEKRRGVRTRMFNLLKGSRR
jgi:glycosyltransferase involved in cell wall biosynthesis